MTNIKLILFIFFTALIGLSSCKEEEYALGELTTPSGLAATVSIIGVDAENPDGDGSGKVFFDLSATNVLSYTIDFGDGLDPVIFHTDTFTYNFGIPGTMEYDVKIMAVGKGGTTSSITTNVKVFVDFKLPADMITSLTGDDTKIWIVDKDAVGHFGMGPNFASAGAPIDHYTAIWWNIDPTDPVQIAEKGMAWDDEVSLEVESDGSIYMTVDNKGSSFLLGANAEFYGFSGSDGGYPVVNDERKLLTFGNATSITTSDMSTRIKVTVPGNGLICFGAGSNTYEILELTPNTMYLHTTGGANGFAWFQRLKPKS